MSAEMAHAQIKHVKDQQAYNVLLHSPSGAVAKDLARRGIKVTNQAKRNLERTPRRIDTGNLRSDIHWEILLIGGKPVLRVGFNLFYGVYVHDGTGIYGPRGTPITPKNFTSLRWFNKKAGKYIFAKSVKGMRPNPFLKDAVKAAKD